MALDRGGGALFRARPQQFLSSSVASGAPSLLPRGWSAWPCCARDAAFSFRAVCGLLSNPRSLQTCRNNFPSHPVPRPQKTNTAGPRATRAHNEKQVSPRDLSAQAVQQLGVTAWGQGRGVGIAALTQIIQLPGPSTG